MPIARPLLLAAWTLWIGLLLPACADAPERTPEGTTRPPADARSGPEVAAGQRGTPQEEFAAYLRLQQVREAYRRIAEQGGWPEVPSGDVLATGDSSTRVLPLRERLARTGDLTGPAAADSVYDERLAEAVRRFQERHGLAADGLLGPSTLEALNVPAAVRVRQIEQTLERMADLPDSLGRRFVLVNIPEFRLRAYEAGGKALQMPVIVGSEYDGQATPVFNDRIEYLVFRPYWNIPVSIAKDEIVPEARKDRDYLAEHDYEIVSDYSPDAEVHDLRSTDLSRVASGALKLRQKPGPENALGLVKFMFPNEYAIYLHGTPEDHLFEERTRSFSHGCIRVARPTDLAAFLLNAQPDWSRDRIETAMQSGERQEVRLNDQVPVYIVYWTAFAEENGTVQFREDIYGRYDQAAR